MQGMILVIHIKRIDTVFITMLETANKASIKIQLFNLKKESSCLSLKCRMKEK
jgi:hypothetical protein